MDFPTPPYTIVVPTAYGQMILNRNDTDQFHALAKKGTAFDPMEIVLLTDLMRSLPDQPNVIDVGANFGAHALALARAVAPASGRGGGKVHAFEAQRIIFNMLAGSVALNALSNLYCYHMAVGDHEGQIEIPQFDYTQSLNFGSVEFGATQTEALTQTRGHDPDLVEYVPLTTLDRFGFNHVGLIKIDVEGMEMQVLDGAMQTISRNRPVLYVEYLKVDGHALRARLEALNYDVYVNTVNYLCIPHELRSRIRVSAMQQAGNG